MSLAKTSPSTPTHPVQLSSNTASPLSFAYFFLCVFSPLEFGFFLPSLPVFQWVFGLEDFLPPSNAAFIS